MIIIPKKCFICSKQIIYKIHMTEDDGFIKLACGHCYHFNCYFDKNYQDNKCPKCEAYISGEIYIDE